LQLLEAYVGMAVAATLVAVKVAQKAWALDRCPGVWVARNARRQLSAAQSAAAKLAVAARRARVPERILGGLCLLKFPSDRPDRAGPADEGSGHGGL
jgi:hypothetical protein